MRSSLASPRSDGPAASAVGGSSQSTFENPEKPIVNRLEYDLSALCIIDSARITVDCTDEVPQFQVK